MRVVAVLALACASSAPTFAQAPYVGASLIGEVARVSGYGDGSGNGETFGGALRAGMPLGNQWGVELEFARSGKMDASPEVSILASAEFVIGAPSEIYPGPAIFPPPQISSERQLTTISTMLWWDHQLSDRVSFAYLGGVSFTRTSVAFRIDYPNVPIPFPLPAGIAAPSRPTVETKSAAYDADVAVGMEGRIGMTEHLRLVPGIRLQTAAGGWAIRPGVGLQWMF